MEGLIAEKNYQLGNICLQEIRDLTCPHVIDSLVEKIVDFLLIFSRIYFKSERNSDRKELQTSLKFDFLIPHLCSLMLN